MSETDVIRNEDGVEHVMSQVEPEEDVVSEGFEEDVVSEEPEQEPSRGGVWKGLLIGMAVLMIFWFANSYGKKAEPEDEYYLIAESATPTVPLHPNGSTFRNLRPGIGRGNRAFRVQTNIGFASEEVLAKEFQAHGDSFGVETQEQYLALAQELRDRPSQRRMRYDVLEDGTNIKFDYRTGAFLSYDSELVITGYFLPEEGESYYEQKLNE